MLAAVLNAADVKTTKKVNAETLAKELEAAGCTLTETRVNTVGEATIISLDSAACDYRAVIAAHVYTDPMAPKRALLAERKAIADRMAAGTATDADRRRAVELWLLLEVPR